MTDIMDELFPPEPEKALEIIIDRTTIDTHIVCPFRCKSDADGLDKDADKTRMRECGTEFHEVMNGYIEYLVGAQDRSNPDVLEDMAKSADAQYQPDVLHCAKMTGRRISVWPGSYISHEKQYAYRLKAFGPKKEDVLLTTRPDYLEYGNSPSEIICKDWKTGYKKGGHDFQAMFVSVVLWRSMEGIERVSWQPLYNRFGQWGQRFEFVDAEQPVKPWELTLQDCEDIILQATRQYLADTEWEPRPGFERCRMCPYTSLCPHVESDIEDDPKAYAENIGRMEAEVNQHKAVLKAYTAENGPLQTDDGWWGTNIFNQRPSFRLNKGTPVFVGEDEDHTAEKLPEGL